MGNLVAACPKVTEFEFHMCRHEDTGPIGTEQEIRKFALQFADFALQLRHLEVVGLFEYPIKILNFDLPNLKSFTLDMWDYRGSFFQDLSDRTPSRNLRDGILSHLLPHLAALEELSLGPQSRFPLSDIQAIAQTDAPRLKAFRWLVDDAVFKHDPLANSEKINKAIIDIFNAHSATLSTFIIDEEFDFWNFGMDIFKHLHKAKNLESLRVQLHDIPTKEEIEGLLTACPKLGQSETRLMVVKEFLTECTLATMKYKEDSLEAVESSWGSVHHPMGTKRNKKTDHCQSRAMACPLLGLTEQKPNGSMADGHAEAAVDIPGQISKSTRSRDKYSGFAVSWFPTEIYQMIVNHIALGYDRCNDDQNTIRAKTLSYLVRTCTFLQFITEQYLYSFPVGSRLGSYKGQEQFRLSLAVDSRRPNLVQVLDLEWDPQMSSRRLVIDIERRCSNPHTLKLRCPKEARQGDEFSQTYFEDLADLFSVCPKVRKLGLLTSFKEDCPIPKQGGQTAKFAGQLSHVELDGGSACFKKSMLPYLSPNMISFTMMFNGLGDLTGFLETLGQRCPVMQRLELDCEGITAVDLVRFCKASGSSLKLLYLDNLDYHESVLNWFFPHMQVLEQLILGPDFPLHVQDITAMSSQACLRTFVAETYDNQPGNFFHGATSIDLDRALARFLSAHRLILKTMWSDGDFWLNKDVFESLKLVRNLGCMNLWWAEGVVRKDVDDLLEACPKLKEALGNEDLLDKIYGDSL
ncbi:Leucine-rich repeat domain superfamily [Fusarium oxysporum f. sp. vasinfectum]|nr:Leucine-rich repeat domain superfamily [Fusarium oxysporum f. sp. vasinfectum]